MIEKWIGGLPPDKLGCRQSPVGLEDAGQNLSFGGYY